MVRLAAHKAGGPYTMTVSGTKTITLRNVLFGDVWLASGQSNMEMGIKQVNGAENEIANAENPMLRLFTVPKELDTELRETVGGEWLVCNPRTVSEKGWGGFSAAAYFFGRKLQDELGIPIGLIHASWGGTAAEGWVSKGSLSELPEFRSKIENLKKSVEEADRTPLDFDQRIDEWFARNDPGEKATPKWSAPEAEDSSWKTMIVPQHWEDAGLENYDGIVWFRRTFDLPADWKEEDLLLSLGPIDDADSTFVNGIKVGQTYVWNENRKYRVPAGIVRPGRNVIAVRVVDASLAGGLGGKPDQMFVALNGAEQSVKLPLAGEWRYRPSVEMKDMEAPPSPTVNAYTLVNVRYNAMIHPLFPYPIKGVVWYQGETNVGRADQYEKIMSLLIRDWRSGFGSGEFPFLIVQLANYLERKQQPSDSAWARLRQAQSNIARDTPNSGLAVAIDIGEANDIHPKNKQDVGLRLALIALAKTYGRELQYSGPVYRAMKVEGDTVRLSFDHAETLVSRAGALKGFEIAASDQKFFWADAKIMGSDVIVSSPDVKNPVAVRYGWADNPDATLYNDGGLPATPFRTDKW